MYVSSSSHHSLRLRLTSGVTFFVAFRPARMILITSSKQSSGTASTSLAMSHLSLLDFRRSSTDRTHVRVCRGLQ
jgi:hypothetical protein